MLVRCRVEHDLRALLAEERVERVWIGDVTDARNDDVARDPDGIFVAEIDGQVVGCITTWRDCDAGIGHIPNIAIDARFRGQGLGRQLIQHAMQYFRDCGLTHAKIETLEQNATGQHLYASLGFREVARQIHFVAEL